MLRPHRIAGASGKDAPFPFAGPLPGGADRFPPPPEVPGTGDTFRKFTKKADTGVSACRILS